jgi:hypothetical protein
MSMKGNGRGPPEHIEEQSNSEVHVGKSEREKCEERANCDNQQDRIEAKLDLLLEELGIEY